MQSKKEMVLLMYEQMANSYLMQEVSRVLRVRDCTSLPTFPFTAEWLLLISVLCMSNNYPHTLFMTNTTGVHPLLIEMFIFKTRYPFSNSIHNYKYCNNRP